MTHLHHSLDTNMTDFVVVNILWSSRVNDRLMRDDSFSNLIDLIGQVNYGTI